MKLILAFTLIFAASLALFFPSLNYYFFQDDWFVLNWVQTGDLASFLSFRTDIIYWRPISMPLLFFTAKNLFDLNPLGYHLIAFSIFFALIFAVYKLFLLLGFDRKLSFAASFMYGVWPIHFISLSWFSTTSYIIGPFFQVTSFIFFIKFIENRRKLFGIMSFAVFLLGIGSSEFTLVLPAIFLAWGFLIKKTIYLKPLLPYLITDIIYIFIRSYVFPLPTAGDYQPFLNKQIINNFIWYIAWALGFPENFKTLIFPTLINQSVEIVTKFWTITFPSFLLILVFIRQFLITKRRYLKSYLFGAVWFSIGLTPVITITNHSFPMYLSFSGIGFLYIIITSLKNSPLIIQVAFFCLWFITSFANLQFTRTSHWIKNEQAVSKAYVDFTNKVIPNPPSGSIFYFKPADVEFAVRHHFFLVETESTLKQSLSDQNAMQAIYGDPTLQSFYSSHQNELNFSRDLILFEIYPKKTDY